MRDSREKNTAFNAMHETRTKTAGKKGNDYLNNPPDMAGINESKTWKERVIGDEASSGKGKNKGGVVTNIPLNVEIPPADNSPIMGESGEHIPKNPGQEDTSRAAGKEVGIEEVTCQMARGMSVHVEVQSQKGLMKWKKGARLGNNQKIGEMGKPVTRVRKEVGEQNYDPEALHRKKGKWGEGTEDTTEKAVAVEQPCRKP